MKDSRIFLRKEEDDIDRNHVEIKSYYLPNSNLWEVGTAVNLVGQISAHCSFGSRAKALKRQVSEQKPAEICIYPCQDLISDKIIPKTLAPSLPPASSL